jgi:hypothetical protein
MYFSRDSIYYCIASFLLITSNCWSLIACLTLISPFSLEISCSNSLLNWLCVRWLARSSKSYSTLSWRSFFSLIRRITLESWSLCKERFSERSVSIFICARSSSLYKLSSDYLEWIWVYWRWRSWPFKFAFSDCISSNAYLN